MQTSLAARPVPPSVANFDQLPDSARLNLGDLIRITRRSRSSVERDLAAGRLPAPVRMPGSHLRYWTVGSLRRVLTPSETQSQPEQRAT